PCAGPPATAPARSPAPRFRRGSRASPGGRDARARGSRARPSRRRTTSRGRRRAGGFSHEAPIDPLDRVDRPLGAEHVLRALAPGGADRAATLRRQEHGGERGAHALGAIVLDQEARLAVDDGLGQGAHPPCDDRTPGRHRLERRATRLVGARGHERETVRRAEDEREVTIEVDGEDDLVEEAEMGEEMVDDDTSLAFTQEWWRAR